MQDIKPYIAEGTKSRFYIPRTLAADFTEFLSNDIPNTVMDFQLLRDWYDQFEEGYEPTYIRCEIYPDATKSRYANTDNNMNIRADVNSGIEKGDMLIDPKGMVYLLDWEVALQSNNAPSRALRCNMHQTVFRHQDEVVDEEGYLLEEECDKVIFENLPANAYRYDGRPEYTAMSDTPGLTANALTLLTVQKSKETDLIRVDDKFVWGNDTYIIIDISYAGVNEIHDTGTLVIQAKKVPGGAV